MRCLGDQRSPPRRPRARSRRRGHRRRPGPAAPSAAGGTYVARGRPSPPRRHRCTPSRRRASRRTGRPSPRPSPRPGPPGPVITDRYDECLALAAPVDPGGHESLEGCLVAGRRRPPWAPAAAKAACAATIAAGSSSLDGAAGPTTAPSSRRARGPPARWTARRRGRRGRRPARRRAARVRSHGHQTRCGRGTPSPSVAGMPTTEPSGTLTGTATWRDPAWLAAALAWARERLGALEEPPSSDTSGRGRRRSGCPCGAARSGSSRSAPGRRTRGPAAALGEWTRPTSSRRSPSIPSVGWCSCPTVARAARGRRGAFPEAWEAMLRSYAQLQIDLSRAPPRCSSGRPGHPPRAPAGRGRRPARRRRRPAGRPDGMAPDARERIAADLGR